MEPPHPPGPPSARPPILGDPHPQGARPLGSLKALSALRLDTAHRQKPGGVYLTALSAATALQVHVLPVG